MSQESALVRMLLLIGAIVQLFAVVPLFFLHAWMASLHGMMDIGALPDQPIIGYLTRSCCLLYAVWGALYLLLSLDVDRYLPLVRQLAVLKFALGLGLLIVDVIVGMPWYWTLQEGPGQMAYAGLLFWAAKRCSLAKQ